MRPNLPNSTVAAIAEENGKKILLDQRVVPDPMMPQSTLVPVTTKDNTDNKRQIKGYYKNQNHSKRVTVTSMF